MLFRKFRVCFLVIISILVLSLNSQDIFAVQIDNTYVDASYDYGRFNLESRSITYYSFPELGITDPEYYYSPGYFPNGVESIITESEVNRGIVGTDNRTRITNTTVGPYCSTVYVEASFSNSVKKGTGFVIGPNAVATAAHCLYNANTDEIATSVKVIPAKNGSTYPYGSVTANASDIVFCPSYLSNSVLKNDWAVLELDTSIGNRTGWLGLRWQSSSYNDTFIYNTGYPSPDTMSGQSSNRYMYLGTGYVKSTSTYTFKGGWDASAGNSGGPVFMYDDDSGYVAIGILTSGSSTAYDNELYPTAYSTATRITQDIYNLFVSYR